MPTWKERIGQILGIDKPVTQQIKEKSITLGSGFLDFGTKSLTGEKTISSKLLNAYEGWVYANVSVLAEEISKLEFELYRTKIVKDDVVLDPVLNHPVLDLLDRFNDFTTTSDAMFLIAAHLELTGDAFLLLDNPNSPKNIFILQPDKVELEIGDASTNYAVTAYKYKDIIDGKTTEVTYDPENIIHIKVPNPNNAYRGKSTVEAAAQIIDIDSYSGEMAKNFFKNASVLSLLLGTDQKITRDDLERMNVDIRKNFMGVRNAFKTMILGGGIKPLAPPAVQREMQFLEQQEWTRDKIMALFKNTKTSLGITDDVNRANAESSILSWKRNVIKPKMQRIVDSLNEFLLPRFGTGLILGFKDPVPEDRESKVEEISKLVSQAKTQILTPNEAREILGYDPIEGGDEISKPQTIENPPESIKNVNFRKHFRKQGIWEQKKMAVEIYDASVKVAQGIVDKRPKPKKKEVEKPEPRESRHFDNKQIWEYWEKIIQISNTIEEKFKHEVERFLANVGETAITNASIEKKAKKKALFDEEKELQTGIDLFTPLVNEIGQLSGEETYQLLGLDLDVYVPGDSFKNFISTQVKLFTTSMLTTDKEKLTNLLEQGIQEGQSIPQIRDQMRTEFADFSKNQAERVAKTEILRASNYASIDAYEQSGVVEAKQWLTARDDRVDPVCEALNGKIIKSFKGRFFKDSYSDGIAPPIHPNCRCVLIPVLKDEKAQTIDKLRAENEILKKELEEEKRFSEELEVLVEK